MPVQSDLKMPLRLNMENLDCMVNAVQTIETAMPGDSIDMSFNIIWANFGSRLQESPNMCVAFEKKKNTRIPERVLRLSAKP